MSMHPPANYAAHFNHHFYQVVTGQIQKRTEVQRIGNVDIIIPVYNAPELTESCISSVLNHSDNCRLIVINDASTDPTIREYLDSLQSIPEKNIKLIVHHNEVNLGFLKTVNDAYRLTTDHFVILNSDTEVPPGWLDRLFAPLFAAPDSVASVTPFSNASMKWLGCNFPDNEQDNEIFKNLSVAQIDAFFSKYSITNSIEIFSGCGFCMAFNRAVVNRIGLFDHAVFGRGFGEELDWSLRAYTAGYKHLLATNLFVYHKHGGSFDADEKQSLVETNVRKLTNIYGTQMERKAVINAKDVTRPIRDALAIIADAQTKKNEERWLAVLGADRSTWELLRERLPIEKCYAETCSFVFITYAAEQDLVTVHLLSPYQERIIYLPADICHYMEYLLSLLNVDISIMFQQAAWPAASGLLAQLKRSNRPYEVIHSNA